MLNIDPIVKIDVNVGTSTASAGVFDIGAIIGSTPVTGKFDTSNRYYVCDNVAQMVSDGFLTTSDEYKAAEKYFSVSPAPESLVLIYCFANPYGPQFSTESTYQVGDYVTYNNKLYQCTTAVETAGTWDENDWTEVTTESESPVVAVLDAMAKGAEFYGLYYIPAESETNPVGRISNLAAALEEMNRGVVFYGATGEVDVVTGQSGIFTVIGGSGSKRAIGMYCTSEVNDAAGLMGEAMGLSRNNGNSAFSLCYKPVASATVNNISESDVNKIKAVNGNVYVERTRGHYFIENGATASGLRFDDVLYIDRMTLDIQNTIYDLIANSATKLPQNDSTSAIFLNAIHTLLEGYYNIGVLATAKWRGTPVVGKLESGDYVEHGHAEFVDSFDLQSNIDRAAHKAMPITVLLCLAGSVESIEITVNVQT